MSEKEWLECKYQQELDEAKLTSIFYFSLIWNVFEKELCNKYANIKKHSSEISENQSSKVDNGILSNVFTHFQLRYIDKNGANKSFTENLFKSNEDEIKNETYTILINKDCTDTEKLKALLYIAFRLRNNLFHGEKEVDKLHDQNDNFKHINWLLMDLIDKHRTHASSQGTP